MVPQHRRNALFLQNPENLFRFRAIPDIITQAKHGIDKAFLDIDQHLLESIQIAMDIGKNRDSHLIIEQIRFAHDVSMESGLRRNDDSK